MLCPGVILAVTAISRLRSSQDKLIASRKILAAIRSADQSFSAEKFLSMASASARRIYYTGSMEDIEDFAQCDLIPFLKEHSDAVNCEQRAILFENREQTEDTQYITVIQYAYLFRDCGKKISRKKQTVRLRFAAKTEDSGNPISEWKLTGCEKV